MSESEITPNIAIVFDFDGVIIDTETPLYLSWREIFDRYDAHLDLDLFASFIGGTYFDIHAHLEEQTGLTLDRDQIGEERKADYRRLLAANPILPGIVDYLTNAATSRIPVGLASNSDRRWVTSHLADRGLLSHFSVLKTREDVDEGKPNPSIYLAAVDELGTDPHMAIAIEDSANGVRSAKVAGLFTVAVPNPVTKHHSLDAADLVVDSLADLAFPRLLELARSR